MRVRWIVIACVVLAAVALGWSLRLHDPPVTDERATAAAATESATPAREPNQPVTSSRAVDRDDPIDSSERARFNEHAREFFAQAPGLSPEEARSRAESLAAELSRIERAGGMSAGEIFLIRVGLVRATEPDEQQQIARIRELKERYQADSRQRSAQASAESDPMFQLYKVRESEIVAEVMAMQTIPDGLSREEYLRRRLQAAREQLLAN